MPSSKQGSKRTSILENFSDKTAELNTYLDSIPIGTEINTNRAFLITCLHKAQSIFGYLQQEVQLLIADRLRLNLSDVYGVVSFYSFFSDKPLGEMVIHVCDDVIDKMAGANLVEKTLKKELGIKIGETTKDGKVTLKHTPCIGMCDQAPAALFNDTVVTNLSPQKIKNIIETIRKNGNLKKITTPYGDGNNSSSLIKSMVTNNIRRKDKVIFTGFKSGESLSKALAANPDGIIKEIKASNLLGRGGAGFPTGLKWEFTRKAEGDKKFVICNADEGEPGTFKDRVLLTEKADMLFEGMTIAGYAISSDTGILYLRKEYAYLYNFLEDVLEKQRKKSLLGKNILGTNFNFDISILMGAGAYICGEESALISSCEGLRGVPKNRPPFPVEKGYFQKPTLVNNAETFCCASKIIEKGADWFSAIGTKESAGTKLLSISGDCKKPGVYEFQYGITIDKLLKEAGAKDTQAVQVGGPSGTLIGSKDFGRKICYSDLSTGGAIIIFNKKRNILKIVYDFMEFFYNESCGKCTPCRVGIKHILDILSRIIHNKKARKKDIAQLKELAEVIKKTAFCGLGQSAANPILNREVLRSVEPQPK